jgi:hypothetical protein
MALFLIFPQRVKALKWFLSISAVLFSAVSLALINTYLLPGDEGGVKCLAVWHPLLGYWLWLASMGGLLVHLVIAGRRDNDAMEPTSAVEKLK